MNQLNSTKVYLVLHEERAVYSIGEAIRPQLEIVHNSDGEVQFKGFVFNWELLAFVPPSFVHLVDPEGLEMAAPYSQEKSGRMPIDPIKVGPRTSEWLFLPLAAHFHIRQEGEYVFSLELLDNLNELHQSNQVHFRLEDVASNAPRGLVDCHLGSQVWTFDHTKPVMVEVVLTNNWDRPLIFLKPQEDSFYGWVNPVYQFTVLDAAAHTLPLALRSGTMATPVYDERSRFIVGPGDSYRQALRLPDIPQMRQPGEYRVRLTYIVRDRAIGKGGVVLQQPMNWDEGVFTGRLESNELLIKLE